jgi:hypothetical protein
MSVPRRRATSQIVSPGRASTLSPSSSNTTPGIPAGTARMPPVPLGAGPA